MNFELQRTRDLLVCVSTLGALLDIPFAMAANNRYRSGMKTSPEDRQRYRIKDSHRKQSFVGTVKKDPNTFAWTWSGHIDFEDGHEIKFTSQRSFTTHLEAAEYLRQFARAHIDSRLRGMQQF